MNKVLQRAHQLIDAIPLIPGYSQDIGEIIITIRQHKGGAKWVDVTFCTLVEQELAGGTLRRVIKKRIDVAEITTKDIA